MKIVNTLYVIMIGCLLTSCGTKETVIRFRAEAYNGYPLEVFVGQTSWKATMDSGQGTGMVVLPIDHAVLATVKYGKYDSQTVYLEPGTESEIAYCSDRKNKYFTVTGDLQAENDFLKAPGYAALPGVILRDPDANVLKQADSVMQVNRERIAELPFSEAFKELQWKNLELQRAGWLGRTFMVKDTAAYLKLMQECMPQGEGWMEMPGYDEFLKTSVRKLGLLAYDGKSDDREKLGVRYTLEHITDPEARAYLLDLNIMPILTMHGIAGNEEYVELYRKHITDTVYLAKLERVIETYAKVAAGQPCPDFCMKDINGKEVRLADLRGKYVYIDLWATWCGPCKGEMPSLAVLEEEFAGKDLTFVSISIDKNKDIDLWKKTVADMKLGGIQLHLAEDWEWLKNFMPNGMSVPRFILLDRDGKILDANMTRPSDKATKQKFEDLLEN